MSHSAEKCKGGPLLVLLTYILLQNIKKKLQGGTLLRHKKISEKVAQCREKSKDPID